MSEFRATAPSAPAVFYRSYSRRKEDGTRENFEEAITRTISAIADIGNFTDEQRNLALTTGLGQYCFPSGRSLWVAGTDWSKKPENYPGYYNCCSMHVEEVSTFGLLMELAMMGTGTGAVLEKDVIEKLPVVQRSLKIKTVKPNKGVKGGSPDTEIKLTAVKDGKLTILVRVGDSRQGWAAAYQGLIELAMGQPASGEDLSTVNTEAAIILDLSQVRQAGERLKGFGGTANPIRLQETLERVCAVLSKAVGRKMTATEVCLLIDEAASAVVAGNIRRCLPEDALVHTSTGLVPIKNVQVGDMVQTPIGFRPVVNKFDQGIQEVVELETNGPKPRATANHCVATFADASGGIEWKKVSDLQEGDRLMHSTQILSGATTSLPPDFTSQRPEQSRTAKGIKVPQLNTDVAWLIGFTHGDGCIQLGRNKHNKPFGMITWATNSSKSDESRLIADKIQLALSHFSVSAAEKVMENENTFRLTCFSIRLAEYFYEYIKKPSTSIEVPDFILRGTSEIRAAYLAGVMDSDGAANNRPPYLVTTVYKDFARQVAAIASSLGIACRTSLYRPKIDHWQTKYNVTVPAFKPKYNSIVAQFSAKGKLREGLKMHGFTLTNAMMRESYSYTEMAGMGFNGDRQIASNYETYVKESDIDIDVPVTFRGLGNVDVIQTYDIEVEEAHCFYCDGYLTHNSAGIRQFSSDDLEAAVSKEGLYKQDEEGNWSVDPEREALRMANHTRCYHTKPSLTEIKDAVTKQYWSGEGAIQYVPEMIARSNADLLDDAAKKKFFLDIYSSGNKAAAQEYLKTLAGKAEEPVDDRILSHRMERYGLNPCAEISLRDNLCNLSEIHLNTINPTDAYTQDNAFYAGGLQVAALLQHEFLPERLAYSRKNDPIVGVSFTGLFDFFVHAFGAEWLGWMMDGRPGGRLMRKFSELERQFLIKWRLAAERGVADYCKQAGLRMPNRCTTVQPAGSKSLLTGASPGWHPPKAQRFIRRITFGVRDPLVSALRDYGYSVIPAQSARDEKGNLLDDINDPRVQEVLVEIPTEVSWANMPGCDQFDLSQLSVEAQWGLYIQVQTFYTTHNCFSRDTRFLTDQGVKSFDDYEVGDTVTVLNLDGDWVPASVVNTGDERPMLKITLREGKTGNEKVITSTYCHRFPVKRASGGNASAKIVQAKDLKVGHRFVTNIPDLPNLDENGIRHGIVFGDGSLYKNKKGEPKGAQLYLCGAKRQLQPYFTDFERTHERDEIDQTRIYGLPIEWKSLPSPDCTQSYLAGFVAGLLATDGSICNSTITISTSNKKVVDFIVDQAPRIGVRVGGFTFSEQGGYPNSVGSFGLRLIKATFPENMILRPHHLEHFNSRDTQPCQWKVVAIEPTDPQLGWCVMEPKTNHFTLSDNILVMNTSATLEFREDEIDLLSNLIYENIRNDGGYISAALLARFDANETFPRLPFEPIDKATYDRRMAAVMAVRSVLPEDVTMLDLLKQYDNKDYELKGAAGCDSAKCLLDAGKDTDQVGKLT